jgi:AcrR family transcriptional regulator
MWDVAHDQRGIELDAAWREASLVSKVARNHRLHVQGVHVPGKSAQLHPQGVGTRRRLYTTAIQLIAARGWHATTLRDVARAAGVSVGLLYRCFPSKRAIVLELYDGLSAEYAMRAAQMRPGRWRDRALHAVTTSLHILRPQRDTLAALVSVLVGDPNEACSRRARPSHVCAGRPCSWKRLSGLPTRHAASLGPRPALGRLLYLLHLAIILFWLLDRSPAQRATDAVLGLLKQALRLAAPVLRVPGVPGLLTAADRHVREALFADPPPRD